MKARILILTVCFLAATAYIGWASRPSVVPPRASLRDLPYQLGGWQGRDAADFSDRVMAVLGVDDYANRYYIGQGGALLLLYIGYYESQRQGDSIHSPLNCLPGSGWNPVSRGYLEIPVASKGGGGTIEVNRIAILKGMEKQLVLYWYQSNGRVVASEYKAKVYTVLDAMRTGRTDAALVRVTVPAENLEPEAEAEAEREAVEFVQLLYPHLSRYIPD